jgi:hypothetical protein
MVFLEEINARADWWHYKNGAETYPAVSKDKASYEPRVEYNHKPVPDEIHEEWKKKGKYITGLAVSPGKVWRVPELQGYYLTYIEWDKKQGFQVLFPGKTVEKVANLEYIEWHEDAKDRGHLWFYSPFPIVKKEPDEILGLEGKGEHEHGIIMSSPSFHQGGQPYKTAGINKIAKRFDFCVRNQLITFLSYHNSSRSKNEIVITADIFDELRKIKIESLTNLSDLASMLGEDFESCSRLVNGVKTKVVAGPVGSFLSFLNKEVKIGDDDESLDKEVKD